MPGEGGYESLQLFCRPASDSIKGDLTRHEFMKAAKQAWETIGVTQANPYHLETALLTNIHSASNAARWQELNSDSAGLKRFFPYLQFFTVGDESVCPICGPLHEKTYKRDDPFWQMHYPPLHHRCRCLVEEVSVLDVELEGIKPDTKYPTSSPTYQPPAKGFDRPPAELAEAEQARMMVEALLSEVGSQEPGVRKNTKNKSPLTPHCKGGIKRGAHG